VFVPVLVLGGVEAGLRLGGYGYPTGLFKRLRIGGKEFLVENDRFSLRFFPPELARAPGPIRMEVVKPAGSYRIFILGESAAMGDPEPAYGAGRYLEVLLRERFPGAVFEVVNVAFTAINSHVILPIARDCAAQQGDLWIIYMGNNEMVGPFGAATIFGAKAPPRILVRLNLAVLQTRLGQLLAGLSRHLKTKASTPASWGGMEMFLGNQVPPDAPNRERVYRNFGENLRDILRLGRNSGARVLLNTVAVNLKDCPPFVSLPPTSLPEADRSRFEQLFGEGASLEGQGRFAEAAQRYEQAAKLDPLSADLEFGWGHCLLQLTNAAAASAHFQSACALDTLPFRADSRINGEIERAAREAANPALVLFDAAGWCATNSPGGVPGQEVFYEHVHFNFDGNYQLARGWAEQVARLLPVAMSHEAAAAWASQEVCERRLGLTDWNRCIVLEGMIRRMQQPPLSRQSNNGQRLQRLQGVVSELRGGMNGAAVGRARALYLEALERAPDDSYLHENFASFLVGQGDVAGAAAQWQRTHDLIPQDYLADFRLGELLGESGKFSEAERHLHEAAALRPFISDPWFELGRIHMVEGKLEVAVQELSRARQLRSGDAEYAYEMGRALALLKRRGEAIEQFRQAVVLNPDYWQAHDALGGQLGLGGQVDEARKEFEIVVRLRPNYGRAHLNLGVALLKQGQAAAAAAEFQETLRLDPTNSIAGDYLSQARAAKADRRPDNH
jgi:tetratricopeptide (TPR) repeat protein